MTRELDARASRPKEGGPTFPLSHRFYRAVWGMAWLLLASWTPAPFRAWRRFVLRAFGAKISETAHVHGTARIWYPPNLEMAGYSCLGPRVNCYCMAPIRLGEYALVSQDASLCGGTHDINDEYFQLVTKPIEIGNNAWVAAEAFVGPGVVMGEGAILGARAVAFKDLLPWTVYAGNPAGVIKRRSPFGRLPDHG